MDLNFSGLAVGVSLFLMIGIFHPVVIKAEYYYGTKRLPHLGLRLWLRLC